MDPVKQYRERFWNLCTVLKNIFMVESACTGYCNQGRNCTCKIPMDLQFSDMIIGLHQLSRTIEDHEERIKVQLLADELAKIGNRLHEKNSGNSKSL